MSGDIPVRHLAAMVALPGHVDSRPGMCVAWLEAADRVCGKPAEYLCPRHVKVAERRYERAVARERESRRRADAYRRQQEPVWRDELAKVEAELDRIDPLRTDTHHDSAMVNMPLSKRLPSDSRIQRLSMLHERRASLRRSLRLDAVEGES